jgi:antitoxin HicB
MAMKKAVKAKAKPAAKAAKKPAAKKAPARKTSGSRTASKSSARPSGGSFETFSGKFTVRLPRSLHQALVDRAEREGVSLNLFVTNALSRTVAAAGGTKGRK